MLNVFILSLSSLATSFFLVLFLQVHSKSPHLVESAKCSGIPIYSLYWAMNELHILGCPSVTQRVRFLQSFVYSSCFCQLLGCANTQKDLNYCFHQTHLKKL